MERVLSKLHMYDLSSHNLLKQVEVTDAQWWPFLTCRTWNQSSPDMFAGTGMTM